MGAGRTCSSDASSAVRLSNLLAFVQPTRQGALSGHPPWTLSRNVQLFAAPIAPQGERAREELILRPLTLEKQPPVLPSESRTFRVYTFTSPRIVPQSRLSFRDISMRPCLLVQGEGRPGGRGGPPSRHLPSLREQPPGGSP